MRIKPLADGSYSRYNRITTFLIMFVNIKAMSLTPQPMPNEENHPKVVHLRVLRPEFQETGSENQEARTDQWHGLEPTTDLLKEVAQVSERMESACAHEILRWSLDRFDNRFTMATAFGPEGMVLIHMLSELDRPISIFNLETGYQFPETLELRDEVARRYGIEVELKKPELSVEEYEAKNNGPVYKERPDQCCFDRKLRLLRPALDGKHAWASAIRRDQSPDRAQAPIVAWDEKFHLIKVSPLANWTRGQVWKFITDNDIPYNPLHDQGYPSIGCQPCTRAILLGEDERAGRWSGFAKTECGLHSRN